MGRVSTCSHLQALSKPGDCHGGFHSQLQLERMTLAPSMQHFIVYGIAAAGFSDRILNTQLARHGSVNTQFCYKASNLKEYIIID